MVAIWSEPVWSLLLFWHWSIHPNQLSWKKVCWTWMIFFVQFVKSKTKTLLEKGSLKFCLNNLWPSKNANSVDHCFKVEDLFSSSTLVLVDTKAAAFRHSDSIQTSGKIWKSSPEIVVGIVWNVSLGLEQLPTPREENPQLVQSRWSIWKKNWKNFSFGFLRSSEVLSNPISYPLVQDLNPGQPNSALVLAPS